MGSIAKHEDGQMRLNVAPLMPLAIIGLSFRFPQEAVTSKAFWKMITDKRCASTDTPPDRWRVDSHYHPDNNRNESLSIRGGHYMTGDLTAFDAPFFSLGASEAEAMDPAQRLTLETAYRAIENAGIPIESIAGTKTCVYSGSFSRDYATMLDHDPDMQAKYRATGTATNMLANRVSWFFDLKGPSVNVDTACSSSLVALDLVCQSIWCGGATMVSAYLPLSYCH
jgi:acyl transferase domain-containing protein